VVGEQRAVGRRALGHAVDEPPPQPEDPRAAAEGAAAHRAEERRRHSRGDRAVAQTERGLDRQPHRDVGGAHEDLAAHDAARALEGRAEGNVDRALAPPELGDAEAVGARERRAREHPVQRRRRDR